MEAKPRSPDPKTREKMAAMVGALRPWLTIAAELAAVVAAVVAIMLLLHH